MINKVELAIVLRSFGCIAGGNIADRIARYRYGPIDDNKRGRGSRDRCR